MVKVLAIGEEEHSVLQTGGAAIEVTGFSSFPRLRLSRRLTRSIAQIAKDTDFLIMGSAQFLPAVAASRIKGPVIWDTTECETLHYRRRPPTWANRIKRSAWWILEWWATHRCDVVVAVSEADAKWWKKLFPASQKKCVVIEHRAARPANPSRVQDAARARLVFVGNTSAKHNYDAAVWIRDVLRPTLDAGVEVVLIGPGTEEIQAGSVRGLGRVNDLRPWLDGAELALAPLAAGAGVKTKVLDYVATGLRVIGTPYAFEGLEGCPGFVETPLAELPARLRELLSNPEGKAEEDERKQAQLAYLATNHAPDRTREKWRQTLVGAGIIGKASEDRRLLDVWRTLVQELSNWYGSALLGLAVQTNRYWPGIRIPRVANVPINLRLRDGSNIRMKANEFGVFIEVFVFQVYRLPYLDGTRCRRVVDIGANVGVASIWLARRYPEARILSLEPSPLTARRLRDNIRQSGLEHRVTVLEAAAGAQDGYGRLEESENSILTRVVLAGDRPPDDSEDPVVPIVGAETIRRAMAGQIDLMKLDCEGGEYAVLGASNHDALRAVSAIIGEYHVWGDHTRAELENLLRERGYSRVEIGPQVGDHGEFFALRE
jgi:FkbM family methyltransferase